MIRPALQGVSRLAGRTRALLQRRAVVLLYHRVADDDASDPWGLSVSPTHFAEHLEVLRRVATPLPLTELARRARNGTLPRRAVAVTFDDGYADNLLVAKPLLERAGVPATVFVVTGMLDGARAFWWDELERLLLGPDLLPPELALHVAGATRRWSLGDGWAREAGSDGCDHAWRAWEPPRSPPQRLYAELWRLMHGSAASERERMLEQLRAWRGTGALRDPVCRPLTEAELRTLIAGGGVTLGAHSVSHPSLASLSPDAQRAEIQGSAERLTRITGRAVAAFAYPFGGGTDITAATAALVREAGFECACVNQSGAVTRATDLFLMPRLFVADSDGDAFAHRLTGLLDGARQK